MAKRKHRRRRQDGAASPALRPVAWSALLGAAFGAAVGSPAQADPPVITYAEPNVPARVPDDGARPQPAGPVQLPGSTTSTPLVPITPITAGTSPLALQVTAAETEVAGLGEQLKQLSIERQQISAEVAALTAAWREATGDLHEAETAAESAADQAYRRAAEVPPGTMGSDLRGLGALSPLQRQDPDGSESQATQLKRAREAEQAAYLAKLDAETRQRSTDTRFTAMQATYKQREKALLDLRDRNESQLAEIEREREAQEQRLGSSYLNGGSVNGLAAHPKALQAVRFALAQLGEPYLWGAEGPSRWDCSGLMWGAYKSAGVTLPRVSRDQFQGTKTRRVSPNALLPGDLLFFSSSPTDASKIHHVGMYIGGGRMVHAPTTNDVVKISTVWWSRFFAATRPVGAVPAPPATPPPPAPTTPKPTPTKTKSPTPKPTKTTPGPVPTTPSAGPPTTTPATPRPDPTTSAPEPTPNPPATTPGAAATTTESGITPTADPS